jgi:hypothetical protein
MKPAPVIPQKRRAAPRGWLVVPGLLMLAAGALMQYVGPALAARDGRHYIPLSDGYFFFSAWFVLLGTPAFVLLLALLYPQTRRLVLAPWRQRPTRWLSILLILCFGFTLYPWGYRTTYGPDSGFSLIGYLTLTTAGLVLVLAGAWRALRFLDRPARTVYEALMNVDRRLLLLGTFGFVMLAANLVSWLRFDHIAHVQDSISQLFQARIFAAGKLYLASPLFPGFFDYTHIINNGRWYSQYLFLHSLLLVPFVKLGAPWLLNPLLGALTPPAVYFLGREVYDERTGRLGAVLAALSPFLLNMSAEFMNHSSTLLFVTLFAVFFFRTLRLGRWYDATAAGAFLGLALNVRPFTAVAMAAPFAAFLYVTQRDPRAALRRLFPGALALALFAGLILLYNWLTNGDPTVFGYVVKWGPGHEIGFGKSGWGPEHTPWRGLVNTGNNLNGLNKNLFEWPVPALLPLFALLFSGRADRRDWLLFGSFAALVAAYFFYWYQDLIFGPRFLFEGLGFLVLLTVRGLEAMPQFVNRLFRTALTGESWSRSLGRSLPLVLLLAAAVSVPPLYIHKYRNYFGITGSTLEKVRRAGLANALVFCRELGDAFNANSLDLDGAVVYAKSYGPLSVALTTVYPQRDCYYSDGVDVVRIPPAPYDSSWLKSVLDEMGEALGDTVVKLREYKTVIWPFVDLPPPMLAERGPALTDFRLVSRELFSGERAFDEYLPALACWLIGDPREHIGLFAELNGMENFVFDRYRFTLLYTGSQEDCVVYDIRLRSGDEAVLPEW